MRQVRKHIELNGSGVELLFTPHLYSYKGLSGTTLECKDTSNTQAVLELYADIFFLAGVNAWELDGHGAPDTFPHTRGDFHAFMVQDTEAFTVLVSFAVNALTGKPLKDLAQKEEEAEPKKARRSCWIIRLLRPSSSAGAGRPKEKRR